MTAGGESIASGYSFIIPTIGRADSLSRVLEQIEAIIREPHDLVLALDGCDAATEAAVRGVAGRIVRARLSVVTLETRSGASAARNRAVMAAAGPVCVFLDDDVVISEEWWRAVTTELARGARCLTGPVLTNERSLLASARAQRYLARYEGVRTGDHVGFLAGGNAVILRDLLLSVGGFPEAAVAGDSLLVPSLERSGAACVFVREMWVGHQHDRGLATAGANAFRAGWLGGSVRGVTTELGSLARQVRHLSHLPPFGLNCALLVVKLAGAVTAWSVRP
ncbi:MAG: glycosyltransferase family 2 protein [Candidatus Phosphoribacter sp.]